MNLFKQGAYLHLGPDQVCRTEVTQKSYKKSSFLSQLHEQTFKNYSYHDVGPGLLQTLGITRSIWFCSFRKSSLKCRLRKVLSQVRLSVFRTIIRVLYNISCIIYNPLKIITPWETCLSEAIQNQCRFKDVKYVAELLYNFH